MDEDTQKGMDGTGFVGGPSGWIGSALGRRISRRSGGVRSARCGLQRPNQEGPPPLQDLLANAGKGSGARVQSSIKIGTGRGRVYKDRGGDVRTAFDKAWKRASETLSVAPQLVHVTLTTDVPADAVRELLRESLADGVPFLGRTIAKEGVNFPTIEVMMLAGEGASAVVSSAAVDGEGADAVRNAASRAAEGLVASLTADAEVPFVVFVHTPGSESDIVREGIATQLPATVAYGGDATGVDDAAKEWALVTEEGILNRDTNDARVVIATIPCTVTFMLSAVIKSFAQPKRVASPF